MRKMRTSKSASFIPGQRIGRWVVEVGPFYAHTGKQGFACYTCLCDCGTRRDVRGHILARGRSTSCGCLHRARTESISIGAKYGMWTVTAGPQMHPDPHKPVNRTEYECRCECGTIRFIPARRLLQGGSRSCGCATVAKTRSIMTKHGDYAAPLYKVWTGMKQRCSNPHTRRYDRYGGRGISVCDEWQASYLVFKEWAIANGYSPGLEIDRKDNDGDYSPDNCRFVTRQQNMLNLGCHRVLTAFGETKCLREWSRDPRCSISDSALWDRVVSGWPHESAITMPSQKGKKSISF